MCSVLQSWGVGRARIGVFHHTQDFPSPLWLSLTKYTFTLHSGVPLAFSAWEITSPEPPPAPPALSSPKWF